jgi:PAS domain S-box-containing protein
VGTNSRQGGRSLRFFLLGLAVATTLGAVDAALGRDTILIGTLVAAPLVAAVGAGPRRTALVLAYAIALGVLLGLPNHIFLKSDHLFRLLTVAVGGALGTWISSLRESRERDSIGLRIQYAVARALSEAESLEEGASKMIEAIARPLGWKFGALWQPAGPDTVRCTQLWQARGVDAAGFAARSRELALRKGEGLPGRVWASGRLEWIPDVAEAQNFPRGEAAGETGLHGAVAFPVLAGRHLVGVVEFFAPEVRRPDRDLMLLMDALGAQIGEWVENQRAGEALRASEARKAAMLESALDGVVTIDHRGAVVDFNPAAEEIFGYTADEACGQEMAMLIVPPGLRERHREALTRNVKTGRSTILGRRIELTGMRKDGSEFPVELTINRIGGQDPPMFTGYIRDIAERRDAEEEREGLLRLEQTARLEASQARDQLEAILRGVADGVTAQAPDGRLVFANDAAVRTLGFQSTEDLLAAPVSEVMSRFEVYGENGEPFPMEDLPGRKALDGERSPEALVRFRVKATGEDRWSVVKASPLVDQEGRVVLAINVFEDITEHKVAERRQSYLSEASRLLASSLDPDDVLQQIAALAVPELGDWCVVDVFGEGGQLERVALAHDSPELTERALEMQERYPPDPNSPRGVPNVLRTGRSELYPEIPDEMLVEAAEDEEHLAFLREFGFRSVMIVPMVARGRTLGAITFVSGLSGRRFDEGDLELAEEVARRCATSLENARLYSEHAYIAKTLQESLLPAELPIIPGLETAARFRATGEGTEVGGDFYDLFQSPPGGWTVVVGDVCGKGPDAAAVTALARYTLRAAAMRDHHPARSLEVLNEALLRQRNDRRFCTVAYAYVQPGSAGAEVGLSSGGHPLPLVLRADGQVAPLGVYGTLLGVVPDPELDERSTLLSPGDAIVFYTDGVTDARVPGGFFGEERLTELLAGCAGMPADRIAARIEGAAIEVQEGQPQDDIAVVVLRVAG